MLKKTITFKNILGEDDTVDAYFNLNNIEYLRVSAKFGVKGDLVKGLKALLNTEDVDGMLKAVEGIVLAAYGVRPNNDSSGFIKTEEATQIFSASEPYSVMMMELINDPAVLNDFVKKLTEGIKANPANGEEKTAQSAVQPLTNSGVNPNA